MKAGSTSGYRELARRRLPKGPIGLARMNTRRGDVQASGAALAAGVPFCLDGPHAVEPCGLQRAREPSPRIY